MTNIAPALRIAVTATAIATTFAAHRTIFRDQDPTKRRAGIVLAAITGIAVLASHLDVEPLVTVLPRVFPIGLVLGLSLAVTTLFLPNVRAAFDRMRDADIRLVIGTRAAFGSMLLGFGGLGILPESFALSAGLGDLLVAGAVIGAPGSLDRSGSRAVRAIVHGVGILDMAMVIGEAITIVRPWALEHPGQVNVMTLPWLVVPLMVAMDLHGLRKVFFASQTAQEPLRDGLVTFDALYRERNVTRAGKRLGLSQPATSAALGRLRAMFDDELFVRTPRGLEPTAKCEELAAPVAKALSELKAAIEPHEFVPATTTATFRIGAVDAVIAVVMRAVAARIMRDAKHARLLVRPCNPNDAVALLDAKEIDVALAPVSPVPAHIGAKELFAIRIVVAMRPQHPLAKKKTLSLDDLLGFPHVVVSFSGSVRTPIDVALEASGKARHVAVTLSSFLAVPHVLAESDALAMIPEPFGRRLAKDGVVACKDLPSAVPQPDVKMKLLWPASADRAAASRWLRELVVESWRQLATRA